MSKGRGILMAVVAVFGICFPIFANAYSYSRNPAGVEVPGGVLRVSVNFTGDAEFESCIQDGEATFWQIQAYAPLGGGDYVVFESAITHSMADTNPATETINVGTPGQTITVLYAYFNLGRCGGLLNNGAPIILEGEPQSKNDQESAIFTVTEALVSSPTVYSANAPVQYRPQVSIRLPKGGETFGNTVKIEYSATDKNDTSGVAPDRLGLLQNPVSIYYSDAIEFVDGRLISPEDKKLIIKDLSAFSSYVWNTKDISEGTHYRIVVDAVDKSGDLGESVSEEFAIDHALAVFRVRAEPAASRGEDVKIIVESSKPLSESPKVFVTQRKFTTAAVDMYPASLATAAAQGGAATGTVFEGVYRVVSGYDGIAEIAVFGKDFAGNESDMIVSGGKFGVGVEPPPKPIIISPLDKEITATSTFAVRGSAREDTDIILTVNGAKAYTAKPDKDGNFIFENIALAADFNKGFNVLNFVARDSAGLESEANSITIKFNILPEVSILWPKEGSVISGTTTARFDAKDQNGDALKFSLEASRDSGLTWERVADGIASKQHTWKTSDFQDGEYIMRVKADDGFGTAEGVSGKFRVNNFLPRITFEGEEKNVIGSDSFIAAGRAVSPALADGTVHEVSSLEYSLDEGATWQAVDLREGAAGDGGFGKEKIFELKLSGLREGLHRALFRVKDARGIYGRAVKTVIVDFGPPPVPRMAGLPGVVGDADDLNKEKAGAQFALAGIAEPQSEVTARAGDGDIFSTIADGAGKFNIVVTVKKHGVNEFAFFAKDAADNKSPEAKISVQYNNPPDLKFLSPRDSWGINHKTVVRWEADDRDGDKLAGIALSYRRAGEPFVVLARNISGGSFSWDVSDFSAGGDYQLKLEASDGISFASQVITFAIDNAAPAIELEPLANAIFKKSFTLAARGTASDDFSGVGFVEYSLDGEHWFKALITSGFKGAKAEFNIKHPFKLDDGEYILRVRTVDVAGNISEERAREFMVDTTAPRVGSFTLAKGQFALFPDVSGAFKLVPDTEFLFTVSFERDTAEASIFVGGRHIDLMKNKATGLWSGILFLGADETGAGSGSATSAVSVIAISARDAVGNAIVKKEISAIEITKKGITEAGAKLMVWVLNTDTGLFTRWHGEPYGLQNPVFADSNGSYELFLPAGTFQLTVERAGFQRLRTSSFVMAHPGFVNFDLTLMRREGIRGFVEDAIERFGF